MDGSKSLNAPWTGRLRRTRPPSQPDSGRLRFSYFRTTEQNRLGFVQVANQKTGNRLLTPESYYEIIPKTVFVYISYIVQMQMEPDNSECSPLPLKTAIPNRPPLAVQP